MATQNNISTSHSRYERKFFISVLDRYEIESFIMFHPAAFSEIYCERPINNIYFDSFNMKGYFDNVFGAGKRAKVRVRWYGELFGKITKPVLEFKMKEGLLCNKLSFPLKDFSIDTDFSIQTLRHVFDSSDIPEMLRFHLNCIEPTLFNTYRRKYYLSRDNRYRLTLDSNLEFLELAPFKNNFLNRLTDHVNSIVELKYGKEFNEGVDRITSCFPFRMTKSSKYIIGIERLNLMKVYSHV